MIFRAHTDPNGSTDGTDNRSQIQDGGENSYLTDAPNGVESSAETDKLTTGRPPVRAPGLDERLRETLAASREKDRLNTETFLDCPPCPFRRTSFGSTHCGISTDPYVDEIDPLTCFNCDVPLIISVPRCRFLTLGTGIRSYRGEGKLVVQMACKELNIRLYNFESCKRCPLMSEVESLAVEMISEKARSDISIPVTKELVEQIAGDIKLDFLRRDARTLDDFKPNSFLRCWRFEDGYCRKFPEFTRGKITCVLPENDRNKEIFDSAIAPAVMDLNMTAYRFKQQLADVDSLCQVCENQQEGDYVIYNLEEWSSSALMLIGFAFALGKQPVLLLRRGFPKPPLLALLEHSILEYDSIQHLYFQLKAFFAPLAYRPSDSLNGGKGAM